MNAVVWENERSLFWKRTQSILETNAVVWMAATENAFIDVEGRFHLRCSLATILQSINDLQASPHDSLPAAGMLRSSAADFYLLKRAGATSIFCFSKG